MTAREHSATALRTTTRALIVLLATLPATQAMALPSPLFEGYFPDIGLGFDPGTWTPPEPVDPGPGLPPLYATSPSIDGRTHDSIAVSFHNGSDALVGIALERSAGRDGAFATVRCWNTDAPPPLLMAKKGISLGGNGCIDAKYPAYVIDSELATDSLFCYRTRVWDAAGTSLVSPARCAYTRGFAGAAAGDPAVEPWRARLVVETGEVANAGTDDAVRVGLNDHWTNTTPHGNHTWLDYPHDDFEAGSQFSYDLNLETLEDLHDITTLSIFKDGSDWWCVSRVSLVVDTDTLFEMDFSGDPDGCRWVGNNDALAFSHAELRSSSSWGDWVEQGPGFTLEGIDTISRIEGAVGHMAHSTELYWDGDDDGVTLSKVDDSTVHVEVETTAYVNNWSDPTVRMHFDVGIEISCMPDADPSSDNLDVTIQLVPRNAEVSAEGALFEVGEFFYCAFEGDWNCIEEAMNEGAMGGLPSYEGAAFNLPLCPSTTVDEFGSVTFGFQ